MTIVDRSLISTIDGPNYGAFVSQYAHVSCRRIKSDTASHVGGATEWGLRRKLLLVMFLVYFV